MKTGDYFGTPFQLKSVSEREDHAFISSYVSENDLKGVEGLDLIRLDDRYEVYRSAAAKGSIVASPTMMLATGHQGFFSLLPVYKGDILDGYVLTSFRLDGLMKELFSNESLGYSVTDITDDKPQQLYRSKSWSRDGYNYSQVLNVGGRRWNVDISDSVEQRPVGYLLPPAIMTTALILAVTLYGLSGKSYRRQLRASQTK